MTTSEPSQRLWSRASIRLELAAYAASGTSWLLTISTLARADQNLADPVFADAIVETLERSHDMHGCRCLAYCVMPDHVHTVTVVESDGNVVRAINSFKSYSTKLWWTHAGHGQLWQRSFHDRGLRTVAEIEAAVAYVQENPLRAGVTNDAAAYRRVGGELLSPS